jgi:flagellar operon protein
MTQPLRISPNGQVIQAPLKPQQQNKPNSGSSFVDVFSQAQETQCLRFSNHAQKRLQTREISLTDDGLARLTSAVEKAEKRGGRESLVLMDEMAFIVNIREKLVVTAMDARSRGEGVFTQIDSVVLADKAEDL